MNKMERKKNIKRYRDQKNQVLLQLLIIEMFIVDQKLIKNDIYKERQLTLIQQGIIKFMFMNNTI